MGDERQKITHGDIEQKFRAIKGGVDQRTFAARANAKPIAIGGAVFLFFLAYLIGKRVGKTKSTIVEIRRI